MNLNTLTYGRFNFVRFIDSIESELYKLNIPIVDSKLIDNNLRCEIKLSNLHKSYELILSYNMYHQNIVIIYGLGSNWNKSIISTNDLFKT